MLTSKLFGPIKLTHMEKKFDLFGINEMSGEIYLHRAGSALWDNSGWEISF